MRGLVVTLNPAELQALSDLSEQDCRPVRETLRWLLRKEAAERGLLSNSVVQPVQPSCDVSPGLEPEVDHERA